MGNQLIIVSLLLLIKMRPWNCSLKGDFESGKHEHLRKWPPHAIVEELRNRDYPHQTHTPL